MSSKQLNGLAKVLHQLYLLRFVIIFFLLLTGLIAEVFLDVNLPLLPLGLVIAIMVATNFVTLFYINAKKAITEKLLFIQLLIEVLSFTTILYFTGGATNPFTFLFLIPLAVSATVIPGRSTWFLTGSTIFLYSLLLKYYVPLNNQMQGHEHHMTEQSMFSQHVIGMWIGFLVSALIITWFITYLSRALNQREKEITLAHQQQLRNQQMVTLGTLAAGAAHELGTPLASLSLICDDLTDGFSINEHPELFENKSIIKQQINRCKNILSSLADDSGESRADQGYPIDANDMINLVIKEWQEQRPEAKANCQQDIQKGSLLLFDKTLSQALINLLNNAADANEKGISIDVKTHHQELIITITDQGAGISDEQISIAGQLPFSTKPDGMGIGLFLALTTIQRINGNVHFSRPEIGGTQTLIHIPLVTTKP